VSREDFVEYKHENTKCIVELMGKLFSNRLESQAGSPLASPQKEFFSQQRKANK
jgi:hypothetical protein